MKIARAIASEKDHYGQTIAAGLAAVGVLRAGIQPQATDAAGEGSAVAGSNRKRTRVIGRGMKRN